MTKRSRKTLAYPAAPLRDDPRWTEVSMFDTIEPGTFTQPVEAHRPAWPEEAWRVLRIIVKSPPKFETVDGWPIRTIGNRANLTDDEVRIGLAPLLTYGSAHTVTVYSKGTVGKSTVVTLYKATANGKRAALAYRAEGQ